MGLIRKIYKSTEWRREVQRRVSKEEREIQGRLSNGIVITKGTGRIDSRKSPNWGNRKGQRE